MTTTMKAKPMTLEDARERVGIASALLAAAWNHERMEYDTQGANQAHGHIDTAALVLSVAAERVARLEGALGASIAARDLARAGLDIARRALRLPDTFNGDDVRHAVEVLRGERANALREREQAHDLRMSAEKRLDDVLYALGVLPSEGAEAGVAAACALRRDRDEARAQRDKGPVPPGVVDDAVRGRLAAAQAMLSALCKPTTDPAHRDWTMSIPARPDHDPDLVIGAALRDLARLIRLSDDDEAAFQRLMRRPVERGADGELRFADEPTSEAP